MKTRTVNKWLIHFTIVLSFVIALLACQKEEFPDPNTLPKGLTGSWVETSTRTDTIRFNSDNQSGYFYLSRGFAMTNGYWLPKIGSAHIHTKYQETVFQ